MKCTHCKRSLIDQGDRYYCVNCSRSVWKHFTLRKPLPAEKNLIGGRPIGSKITGGVK